MSGIHRHGGRRLASVIAGLLIAAAARPAAHDFWVQPSTFRPAVGSLVGLRLLVGQDMIGDPVPRDPAAIKTFIVATSAGVKDVPGRDGGNPAGILRLDSPGQAIVGYESFPRSIELTPDKFDQYLGEEGLDQIRTLAFGSRMTKGSVRERYVRCAKALLTSSDGSKLIVDRRLGLTLELVAARNSFSAQKQPASFNLTYNGQPRPGALVIALKGSDPSIKLKARTDKAGRVSFVFPSAGQWLVKAVHMIPSPTSEADWESFWASLSFNVE